MKKIIVILGMYLALVSCRHDNYDYSYTAPNPETVIEEGTATIHFNRREKRLLYPKNGQKGGIGELTRANLGIRVQIINNTSNANNWTVKVRISDDNYYSYINYAKVYIYCKQKKNEYRYFKLQSRYSDGEYYLENFDLPLKKIRRAGFIHVVDRYPDIDYKIGFGITEQNITEITVNGHGQNGIQSEEQNAEQHNGNYLTLEKGTPLEIKATCTERTEYFQVELSGDNFQYIKLNCHAPDGKITIPSSVTSQINSNSHIYLSVKPHNVYIPKAFDIYRTASLFQKESISTVSVQYGGIIEQRLHLFFK